MAEIDWDKIIKTEQSKKTEQKRKEDIENRLDRMEKLLEKAVETEHGEPKKAVPKKAPKVAVKKVAKKPARREADYGKADFERVEIDRAELERAGYKFVKVPKRRYARAGRRRRPMRARRPVRISMPKINARVKLDLSNKRNLVLLIGIIAVAAIAAMAATGNLNFDFTGFISQPQMYVCSDGVTTVENITMCPTTTTTTIPTTTTTTTTLAPTTTTTLPACSGNYCVWMSSLTCENNLVTANLKNSGSKTITGDIVTAFKFFVNDEEKTNFVCSPLTVAVGEDMTCLFTATETGTYDIEVRGVSMGNIETGTVVCR